MRYRNPNFGKSPFDPDYRDDYNQEADLDAYNEAEDLAMERYYEKKYGR